MVGDAASGQAVRRSSAGAHGARSARFDGDRPRRAWCTTRLRIGVERIAREGQCLAEEEVQLPFLALRRATSPARNANARPRVSSSNRLRPSVCRALMFLGAASPIVREEQGRLAWQTNSTKITHPKRQRLRDRTREILAAGTSAAVEAGDVAAVDALAGAASRAPTSPTFSNRSMTRPGRACPALRASSIDGEILSELDEGIREEVIDALQPVGADATRCASSKPTMSST